MFIDIVLKVTLSGEGCESEIGRLLLRCVLLCDECRCCLGLLSSSEILRRWSIAKEICRFDVLDIDIERLAQYFDFELEVELEVRSLVQFDEEAKDCHEPRVRRAEDSRFRALFENFANERNGDDEAFRVVTFDEELLEGNVVLSNRFVLRQS